MDEFRTSRVLLILSRLQDTRGYSKKKPLYILLAKVNMFPIIFSFFSHLSITISFLSLAPPTPKATVLGRKAYLMISLSSIFGPIHCDICVVLL